MQPNQQPQGNFAQFQQQTQGFPGQPLQQGFPPQPGFPPQGQGGLPQASLRAKMEESAFPVLNTGYYRAVIKSITPENQTYGLALKWMCQILGIQEEVELSAICTYKLTPKSKLYEWLVSLGHSDIQMGQEVILDHLIGKEVVVFVQKEEKNGRTYSNIKSFMLPQMAQGMVAPAPAAPVHPQGQPIHQGQPVMAPQRPVMQAPPVGIPTAAPPPPPMQYAPPAPQAPMQAPPQGHAPAPPQQGDSVGFF